nr:sodium-dependent transporter [uncultured Mediterraneibacter sp.]
MQREKFGSRLGFILISAGCAIGLGNVWRFPYITGKYGGAAFVLIYLVFLVLLGLPIMVMEFAVGRASQASVAMSFDRLEPLGTKWHWYKWFGMAGNYLLMMFYTTIGGWILLYVFKMAGGEFEGKNADEIAGVFGNLMEKPGLMTICMIVVVAVCFGIVCMGLQKGVEKITKKMMILLLALMVILAIRSATLPGAGEGLRFYLLPDFKKAAESGLKEVIFAAMGQSFFTLSLGIGAIAIFGSYIDKKRRLTEEAVCVTVLDTCVALIAGMIIFPACFAFGVQPDSGPSLIFITLPNIFNSMSGGRIWGTLFFLCMLFAAASTIIAVFENIIAFAMDLTNCSRAKAVVINLIAIVILSLPCILGFNVLSGFQPLGAGSNVLDLEDFIVSNNLLPLGSLVYLLFCTSRYGWGWKKFCEEANAGEGIKFPKWTRIYVSYILPLIVLFIFVQGYWSKFVG